MRTDPAPIVIPADAESLSALASGINAAHAECERAARDSLRRAIDAGGLLNRAKSRVPHGGWLPWLGANCPGVPARTAQLYMRVARRAPELEAKCATVADLPLREAARLLSEPVEPEPAEPDQAPEARWSDGLPEETRRVVRGHADAIRALLPSLHEAAPGLFPAAPQSDGFSYTPWRDMTPESRRDTVERWPDLRFQYAALFDAAGWPVERIAGEMGLPVEQVLLCPSIDPRSPVRFDTVLNGRELGTGTPQQHRETERHYRDVVAGLLAQWAHQACAGASGRADYEGYPEAAAALRVLSASHGRRLGRLPGWPARFFARDRENTATNVCALTDARVAVGIETLDEAVPGGGGDSLLVMLGRFMELPECA